MVFPLFSQFSIIKLRFFIIVGLNLFYILLGNYDNIWIYSFWLFACSTFFITGIKFLDNLVISQIVYKLRILDYMMFITKFFDGDNSAYSLWSIFLI